MRIYLASDHAGFALKETLMPHLRTLGHEVHDCGAYGYQEGDDYPVYVKECAKKVAEDSGSFGIILGASGQGEAMVANRIPGVRAFVYYGPESSTQVDAGGETLGLVESGRKHNDANILSIGARFVSVDEAKKVVELFLATPFSNDERHIRRISAF